MKIMVACPTRGHVWYETAMSLAELPNDKRVSDFLYVQNTVSVIEARNEIMRAFLDETDAEVLLMVDDDVIPHPDVLDMEELLWKNVGIVGAPCPLLRPGLPVLPNLYTIDEYQETAALDLTMSISEEKARFAQVDAVGFGCVMVVRELAELQPTFETRVSRETGKPWMGEDIDYCLRAEKKGYKTMISLEHMAEHMVSVHAGGLAQVFLDIVGKA